MARPTKREYGRPTLRGTLGGLLGFAVLAAVLLGVGAAAVGHLAYGVEPTREGRLTLDGLGAVGSSSAKLLFTSANKPVVLRPDGDSATGEYTYVMMPVRLPG